MENLEKFAEVDFAILIEVDNIENVAQLIFGYHFVVLLEITAQIIHTDEPFLVEIDLAELPHE